MENKKKKITKIKNQNYDSIANDYSSKFFITDKITNNTYLKDNKTNYQYAFVAICKNGGLIAMCKTPGFFELGGKNPILKNIIVMRQDGRNAYRIPNRELFKNKKVVGLEFNYKEQLYAFCDNGEIYKIDILKLCTQKLDIYFTKLNNEKILKAKPFEKGFVILTGAGTIFYMKDIKGSGNKLEFMVSLRDNLNIKNYQDCDFIVIPSTETEENSDEELLVCKPNDPGVYLIKKIKSSGSEFRTDSTSQNYSDMKVNIFYINSKKVEKFNSKKKEIEHEDLENELNDGNKIGNVSAIAISECKKKIALYVAKKKSVYIFPSKIPTNGTIAYKKLEIKVDDVEVDEEKDKKEINNILEFKNKQLLFLTDDCVAICGGRWLVMINEEKQTYVESLEIEKDKQDIKDDDPFIYCKGIAEVDGIRLMTNNEILLFRKLPKDIKPVYDIFKLNDTRKLILSYEKYVDKDPFCNNELREIKDKLSDTIFTLVKAAGYLYWIEKVAETHGKKDLQNFFLRAANYGKSIFGKNEFNFDRFNNLCKNLRIINTMKNFEEMPRFLTLEEYEALNSDQNDSILKKTMRQLNFKLAFKIAKYLGLPEKDVFLKFALTKIRKIEVEDTQESEKVYNEIMPMLKKLENISYIEIAKKCFKYNNYKLGEKFLNEEKSSLVKIPKYLELKEWNNALNLAIQTNDINALMVVLDNIYKVEEEKGTNDGINEAFIQTLLGYPTIKIPVVNYLKKNNKMKDLLTYLEQRNDQEERFYLLLENYFQSNDKNKREEYIKQMKNCKFEKNEKKFYENYISDLESSLIFKKECLEKGIFDKNETTNFDNSIFDCYEKAIKNQADWIEEKNKKNFHLSNRKLTILRFKELLKEGKKEEIDKIVGEKGVKKLDISYIKIAKMFLESGDEVKAIEYAQKEDKENLFEEKANFFLKLGKYEEAALVAVKIKDDDIFENIFNIIANKTGKDKATFEEIQKIYDSRKK